MILVDAIVRVLGGNARRRAVCAGGAVALLSVTCLGAPTAQAQDATWLPNPGSGDFDTAANWTPATVPAGTATFNQSNTTTLTFSSPTIVGTLQFSAAAPAYTFNLAPSSLVLDGAGVVNGSANVPTLNATLTLLQFSNSASAGNAIITSTPGAVTFADSSRAGGATITTGSGGLLSFTDNSTADGATITTNSASLTQFTTSSTGGNARLTANGSGQVDFSGTSGPASDKKITAGSIAGAGNYFLGGNQLTVGSNGLSTTVSGVIDDGGTFGGASASLVKVGNGTLTLAGANTYSGATTVNAGKLAVIGSIVTPTTVNAGGTLGGTGAITNTVTVNASGTLAPGLSVGTVNTGSVAFAAGSSFTVEIDGSGSDLLDVTGTVSLGGALLNVSALAGYLHTPGAVYTIIANDGADPVSGTFAGLPQGATVGGSPFLFRISYVGGDGNDVTLEALITAAPTLSEWAQIGLALVMTGVAVWYLRRRRGLGTRPASS